MAKSEKLYKDSPSIKKDGDGKPKITKPTKADGENMGVEGNGLEGAGDKMPIDLMHERHAKEMKDTHKRHQEEFKDMHDRHEKEHNKLMADGKSGSEEISKIEETK